MRQNSRLWTGLRLLILSAVLFPFAGRAQQNSAAATETSRPVLAPPDGQHDFDFEIGTWKTHVSRRLRPLTGSTTWVDLDGTSVVRKILGGRANLVELDIAGLSGRIEGLSLRLYNPDAQQWSLNFANIGAGVLTPATIGGFKDGRGEFFGQDTLNGRSIFVRFVITCPNRDLCKFEQAFSGDGGKSWETNWIATDTRIADSDAKSR